MIGALICCVGVAFVCAEYRPETYVLPDSPVIDKNEFTAVSLSNYCFLHKNLEERKNVCLNFKIVVRKTNVSKYCRNALFYPFLNAF